MFDKHYIGLDLTSFENNGQLDKVSRITLLVDDENAVTAGDDTGLELSATCPHATQTMAEAILANLKGYQYKMYGADDANIDPAAELGDGATAGGMYSVISSIEDDGSGYVGLAAPGEAEEQDEFPSEGPMTKEFRRKLADVRSSITKTADQILLKVESEIDDMSAYIDLKLDSITSQVSGIDGKVSTLEQTASSITQKVSNLETGLSHSLKLDDSGVYITDQDGNQVSIHGSQLRAGTVTAATLQGSYIDVLDNAGRVAATLWVSTASTADYKLDIRAEAVAITADQSGGAVHISNADGGFLQLLGTRVYCNAYFRPNVDNQFDIGSSNYRWDNIYAVNDVIQTSDRRRKKDISYGLDKYDRLFDGLKPSSYRMEGGKRTHTGLVAQDIEELLEQCGIDSMDFAAFIKTEREDKTGYDYGLRYGEFVPLLIDQLQKIKKRVKALEDKKHG